MRKLAIVINGAGGVGKDTLCNMAKSEFRVDNISSISPIKRIAKMCGWNGKKDDKSRKFLSDLKLLCVEYNDYPTEWAYKKYKDFLDGDDDIMFVHIREPEEISKFVKKTDGKAKTLLVRGGERMKKSLYGNVSDDSVENYNYDYYFTNDKSLDEAKSEFLSLLKDIMEKDFE